MTTTVVFASESERVQTQSPDAIDSVYPVTSAILAATPMTATATLVSSTYSTAASGLTITSGSIPAATSGNLLVAVLLFGVSSVATSTNPSGWALNSMGNGTTNRRIEVWSKRSNGTESGVLTWTKASGSSPWACYVYELSGSVAGGLALVTAFTNPGSVSTAALNAAFTAQFGSGGIFAFAAAGAVTAITKTDGANTASVLTFDNTFTHGAVEIVRHWNNAAAASATTTFSWTTARAVTWVGISLVAATSIPSLTAVVGNTRAIGFDGIAADTGEGSTGGQDILEFDTSAIGGDLISSATLALDCNITGVEPVNATLEAWAVTTPDVPTTRGANDNNWFRGTASYGGLTKCATFPAASTWSLTSLNTLTSEAAFPAQIQTAGTTRLMLTTDDLRLGTARTTDERYPYLSEDQTGTTNDPRITIVHTKPQRRTLLGVGQ